MRESRFENDLKNLANDISGTLNMKKQSEDFILALNDCMTGIKSFNKKIENLISTGELLEEIIQVTQKDLFNVFGKKNKEAHDHFISESIRIFSQYGTSSYKESLKTQLLSLDSSMWQTNKFTITIEPLYALFIHGYIQFHLDHLIKLSEPKKEPKKKKIIESVILENTKKINKNVDKFDYKHHIDKLLQASKILVALKEDLEDSY